MDEITNEQVAAAIGVCLHPKEKRESHYYRRILGTRCRMCGECVEAGYVQPDYLHSLDAAGLVLEWLRERGCYIEMAAGPTGEWEVGTGNEEGYDFTAKAHDLPEAICRAALALSEQEQAK